MNFSIYTKNTVRALNDPNRTIKLLGSNNKCIGTSHVSKSLIPQNKKVIVYTEKTLRDGRKVQQEKIEDGKGLIFAHTTKINRDGSFFESYVRKFLNNKPDYSVIQSGDKLDIVTTHPNIFQNTIQRFVTKIKQGTQNTKIFDNDKLVSTEQTRRSINPIYALDSAQKEFNKTKALI